MPAATFLQQLYRYPGIKSRFDGVSLHPYAVDSENARKNWSKNSTKCWSKITNRPAFYNHRDGMGSQNNFKHDAFEQGPRGQVKQMRASYEYLLANQRRLNLEGVYWFSWKDLRGNL